MKRQKIITISIILTIVVFSASVYAESTVLQLVPQDSTGFVYMGNPMRLSQKVDEMASDLTEQPQQELLAKLLADSFGAEFESLDELQRIGFDLKKELCIFFHDKFSEEKSVSVIAHVHDPDGVKKLLQEVAIHEVQEPMEEKEYDGIKYLDNGAAFAVFDELFVMVGNDDRLINVIDTYKSRNNSVLQSPNYKSLNIDLSDKNEIAVFLNFDKINQIYSSELEEIKLEAANSFQKLAQTEQIKGSQIMGKVMLDFGLWMLDQLDVYFMTADIEGSIAKINKFVKFKEESELQHLISNNPKELDLLEFLPHGNFMSGSATFKKDDWINLSKIFFEITQDDLGIQQQNYDKFIQGLEEFHEYFEEEFAFTSNASDFMIPDMLYIFKTRNQDAAREYMKTGYMEYLKLVSDLELPTAMVGMNAMADATRAEPEIYDDIEIQRIILPNMDKSFEDMPEEIKPLTPKELSIWYTIKDNKMILSISSNSEPIRRVIDVINGDIGSIKSDRNYSILSDSIDSKNNLIAYFSPIMLIKRIAMLVSQTNPDIGGMVTMMVGNLPDTYNIALSTVYHDKGIEANAIIALDDLKQVIQMILVMNQQ